MGVELEYQGRGIGEFRMVCYAATRRVSDGGERREERTR